MVHTEFDRLKEDDARNCKKGIACGNSCISQSKKCKQNLGTKAAAIADHISDPANLEKGAESSESSGSIETAKDAIAKGEQFLKDELNTLDKLNADAEQARSNHEKQFEMLTAVVSKGTPEEKEKAFAEYGKSAQKLSDAEDAADKHFDKIYEKVLSGDREKGAELAGNLKLANGAPAYSKDIKENASDLFTMSNGKGSDSLKVIVKAEDRAYALKGTNVGGVINTGKDPSDKRVLFHEMAHHIEFENPKYAAAAKDFVLSRATGEEKQLKEITGNPNYRDDETAFPDKFISPYVGKVYKDGSTEVLSMGVEKMVDRETAKDFMKDDREHFLFTVGVLKD